MNIVDINKETSMPIINECYKFLSSNATGKWIETYRSIDADTNKYLHPVHQGMILFRVERNSQRCFYWLYNIQDAIRFNEFVGMNLKAECHEIIITPRCRLFYDIDLVLDEDQVGILAEHYGFEINDGESGTCNTAMIMDEVGKCLANVFKNALLISLEEHGIEIESDLVGFDWMFTMRNRALDDNKFKISIHLITNLILSLSACSAIVSDIKKEVIPNNTEVLDISDDMVDLLVQSIDCTQYRPRGSLGLPFGTKKVSPDSNEYLTNWVYRNFSIPGQKYFITIPDQFSINNVDLSNYNIIDKSNYIGRDASPEFVKEALKHAHAIKDYNPLVWDLNSSVLKRSTMFVKRCAPSMCSICNRVHDNDNTLFLIFNSNIGIASWKCARVPDMKPIVFYTHEEDDDITDMIEAFSAIHSNKSLTKKPLTIVKKQKIKMPTIKMPSKYQKYPASSMPSNPNPIQKSFGISLDGADLEFVEEFAKIHAGRKLNLSDNDVADPFDISPPKKKCFVKKYSPMMRYDTDDLPSSHGAGVECTDSDEDNQKKQTELKKINRVVARSKKKKTMAELRECSDSDEEKSKHNITIKTRRGNTTKRTNPKNDGY